MKIIAREALFAAAILCGALAVALNHVAAGLLWLEKKADEKAEHIN